MKPVELLARADLPGGGELRLTRRDTEFLILADGAPLMTNRTHGSEEALAALGCERARQRDRPRVLVGGLGMGFTLRAALDLLPAAATITVAELVPAVVEWNRGVLGPLAGHPLQDPRVTVEIGDVLRVMRRHQGQFDAILLDVDNGPEPFTADENSRLYDAEGLAVAYGALTPGGTLGVWSLWHDRQFEPRLRKRGFDARAERVRARRDRGGARHTIFIAVKSARPRGRRA